MRNAYAENLYFSTQVLSISYAHVTVVDLTPHMVSLNINKLKFTTNYNSRSHSTTSV